MSSNTSTQHGDSATDEPRLVNLRFALRRLISKTALADIYWANDLHRKETVSPEKNVLVLLVSPAVSRLENFPEAWQQVLSRPAPPAPAYPDITDYGEDQGDYWLALDNIEGMLLSERLQELDERGLPLESSLDMLDNIAQTLSSIQAGPFGYLEPGAIQHTDHGYKILNAPLVKVLQQLAAATNSTINKLALHSGYLSPAVAVGDTPVTEDDTFSIACLLHTLLNGQPPFGSRSTLTAVTHSDRAMPSKKLKKESTEILNQALSFQRSQRPENPDKFLQNIRKTSQRKLALPLAALAAIGVVTFAGYHLASRMGDFLQVPDEQPQHTATAPQTSAPDTSAATSEADRDTEADTPAQQANTTSLQSPEPNANNASSNASTEQKTSPSDAETPATARVLTEPTAPQTTEDNKGNTESSDIAEAAQDTATDADTQQAMTETDINTQNTGQLPESPADEQLADAGTNTEQTREEPLTELLAKARNALNIGQIEDKREDQPGALSLLRQAYAINKDNTGVQELLGKLLQNRYNRAEAHLKNKDFTQAEASIEASDAVIREFMLTKELQKQVKLESRLKVLREEQKQVENLLAKAREAMQRGDLSNDDAADNAMAHLNNLMFKQPDNKEALTLLTELVEQRQEAAQQALNRDNIEQAGTYLGEAERLIQKYNLGQLRTAQQTLDSRYQAMIQQVTITPPDTDSQPEIIDLSQDTQTAPVTQPEPQIPQQTTQPTPELPANNPPANRASIQGTDAGIGNNTPEPLSAEQTFVPPSNPAIETSTAAPIWEQGNLDANQVTPGQPVVIYDPEEIEQITQIQSLPPVPLQEGGFIQPQAVISYTPPAQPQAPAQQQPVQPQPIPQPQIRPQTAPPNLNQQPGFNQPVVTFEPVPVAPSLQPISTPFPNRAETLPGSEFQESAGEIPELEELPVSAIEEILPAEDVQ